jgi:DNA-binding transcriptional LysR family regulator
LAATGAVNWCVRPGEGDVVIDRKWLPLNALRAFEAVARHLSFTAGAQTLSVTQSALSRHVMSLEALLGRKLLERRPSGVALTEAGAALLPAVTKSFDRLEQVMNDIISEGTGKPRVLRVHVPPSFLQQLALPILSEFRREFPDIAIDLSSSHVTGLPAHDLDVAVIYDKPQVRDTVADLLWMVRVTPVCAPGLAKTSVGMTLSQFLNANELLHVKLEGQPRGVAWASFARRCGISLNADRGLAFDTAVLSVQYAMSGAGVALADIDIFAKEIAEGRLVAPFDEVCEDGYGYYLTFHPEDLTEPGVALFRSWMIARFARAAGARSFAQEPANRLSRAV